MDQPKPLNQVANVCASCKGPIYAGESIFYDKKSGQICRPCAMVLRECPACIDKRQHVEAEWDKYHPNNRQGFMKEFGFSKQGLGLAKDEQKKA